METVGVGIGGQLHHCLLCEREGAALYRLERALTGLRSGRRRGKHRAGANEVLRQEHTDDSMRRKNSARSMRKRYW
jgi:hypothetical protein